MSQQFGAPHPPQGSYNAGGRGANSQGGQDFLGNTFQNVSPEMVNFGLSAGQDIINKQKERLMPGVSIFWNSLKIYFAVSNNYVLHKILTVLYPIGNKKWARMSTEDVNNRDPLIEVTNHKNALPRHDINAPDLYIPLMSFLTYILLVGYVRGTANKFTPEVLIHSVWICIALQFVETGLMKLGLNMLQVSIPILDLFSYTGYKYIGLCLSTILLFLGSTFHILSTFYTGFMLSYFILKTLAAAVPVINTSGPPRHIVLLLLALMQFLIVVLLSWT
mmetsp:Transcript_33772/g.34409  ORF Transcript_33772/g.34409 Transcript_33772/m.34409 type:complete len:276 (+) Transcript_33772:89-916(+)